MQVSIFLLQEILTQNPNLTIYPKFEQMKCKMLLKIKIFIKRESKEFGIKLKRILYGKKMLKIKCLKNKKVKKHMINGKRNLN